MATQAYRAEKRNIPSHVKDHRITESRTHAKLRHTISLPSLLMAKGTLSTPKISSVDYLTVSKESFQKLPLEFLPCHCKSILSAFIPTLSTEAQRNISSIYQWEMEA